MFIAGAMVDNVDKDGNTALHTAARNGHELFVKTLISFGADPMR